MRYVRTSKKAKHGHQQVGQTSAQPTGPGGPDTLADALVEFAQPLLRLFESRPSGNLMRSLFSLAALAWNEGHPGQVLTPRDSMRARDRLAQEFATAWGRVEPIYQELIRVRRERMAAERRRIAQCRLEQGSDGQWLLYVAGEES
jgi:hypothetical protein